MKAYEITQEIYLDHIHHLIRKYKDFQSYICRRQIKDIKNKMKKIYETAYEYIEEIVKNIAPVDPDKDDLIQDVALVVLEKPPEFISELYDKKQLKYYIARVIMNNLFSTSSPYYCKYKKYKNTLDINKLNI